MSDRETSHASDSIPQHYAALLSALGALAQSYHYQGKFEPALSILKTGEQLSQAGEVQSLDRVKLLLTYSETLNLYYFVTNSDYDLALSMARRVKQAAEALSAAREIARADCLVGEAYYFHALNTGEGDYNDALTSFQASLKRSETLDDARGIGKALFHIGLVHERCKQYAQAREYYRRSLELAEQAEYKQTIAETTRHLAGLVYEDEGAAASLNYALRSLAVREEMGYKRTFPAAHLLVGEMYLLSDSQDQALFHYRQAYDLAKEMGLKSYIMSSLGLLGELQQKQNRLEEARASFTEAHALAQELGLAYGIAESRKKLAELAGEKQDG